LLLVLPLSPGGTRFMLQIHFCAAGHICTFARVW
jgi:hypothetical protein